MPEPLTTNVGVSIDPQSGSPVQGFAHVLTSDTSGPGLSVLAVRARPPAKYRREPAATGLAPSDPLNAAQAARWPSHALTVCHLSAPSRTRQTMLSTIKVAVPSASRPFGVGECALLPQ